MQTSLYLSFSYFRWQFFNFFFVICLKEMISGPICLPSLFSSLLKNLLKWSGELQGKPIGNQLQCWLLREQLVFILSTSAKYMGTVTVHGQAAGLSEPRADCALLTIKVIPNIRAVFEECLEKVSLDWSIWDLSNSISGLLSTHALQIHEVVHCKKCAWVVIFSKSLWMNIVTVACRE